VSWAYGRGARFSYLAVSCAYTRDPWRSRAVIGPALEPGALLIRRSGHIVRDRQLWSLRWADIPQLPVWDAPCPAAWQRCWLQSRRPGADRRPSVFQAWRTPSRRRSCECWEPPPVAVASRWLRSRWLRRLLSPLLSVAANPQIPGLGAVGQRDHWDH
jgi:hypothetical protein